MEAPGITARDVEEAPKCGGWIVWQILGCYDLTLPGCKIIVSNHLPHLATLKLGTVILSLTNLNLSNSIYIIKLYNPFRKDRSDIRSISL